MSFIENPLKGAQVMMGLTTLRSVDASLDRERASGDKTTQLHKAVNDFEALFVNNMLKTMRSTIQKSGLFGDGMREDIYTSLFDWEMSKEMASGGGLGLGRLLLQEFNGPGAYEGGSKGLRDLNMDKKDESSEKKTKVFLRPTDR